MLWMWVLRYYVNQWNNAHPDRHIARAQVAYLYEKEHDGEVFAYPYMELDVAQQSIFPLESRNLIGINSNTAE